MVRICVRHSNNMGLSSGHVWPVLQLRETPINLCPSLPAEHQPLASPSSADSRRSRVRLQRAGGAAELAAAFQDDRLGWEPREQAVGLLQDLAAALAQVGSC